MAILFASLLSTAYAQAQPTSDVRPISTITQGFKSKYNTIAHEILNIESAASLVTPEMYQFIDDLIDAVKVRIPFKEKYALDEIRSVLQAIDEELTKRNVVYPAQEAGMGFVDQLSDGLRPRIMNAAEIAALASHRHNKRRADRIRAHARDAFYVNDSDTASFLYLAAAEALRMPVFLVELPAHNFVRFEHEGVQLDWETMDAREIPPGLYQSIWRIPTALIQSRVYLAAMNRSDVLGYAYSITAEVWAKKKVDQRAFDDDEKALLMYPRSGRLWNQRAWHLATASEGRLRDGEKAIEYALRAVAISATPNILDTLACAYAAAGQFSAAIQTEKAAQVLFGSKKYPAEVEVPEFDKQIRRFVEVGRALMILRPPLWYHLQHIARRKPIGPIHRRLCPTGSCADS